MPVDRRKGIMIGSRDGSSVTGLAIAGELRPDAAEETGAKNAAATKFPRRFSIFRNDSPEFCHVFRFDVTPSRCGPLSGANRGRPEPNAIR
jgi:hypothetical protein